MFSGILSLVIHLTILAQVCIARLNYEKLKPTGTLYFRPYEKGDWSDSYAVNGNKAGNHFDKGYKRHHVTESVNKDQHELDKDYKYFDEDNEGKKHPHHDDGYFDEHHEGKEGEKGGGFHKKGRYGKGYSTHGQHEVKKLDEHQKTTEFHDGDYISGFDNHHNGYHYDREEGKGGYYNGAHRDHVEHENERAKGDNYRETHRHDDRNEYGSDNDDEDYYYGNHRNGVKIFNDDGKSWNYDKGH